MHFSVPPERALHYLLIYDIPDDKIRTRLADICMDYGLARIQYSAFFGELRLPQKPKLLDKLRRRLGEAEGNIQLYPVCERDMRHREIIINLADKDKSDG